MASVDELSILPAGGDKPENAMAAVTKGIEVYLPLKGLIDVEKETQRLNKELDGMTKEIGRIEGKLNNAGFLAKAPVEVVEKEKIKAQEIAVKMQAIQERLTYLKNLE
ncbi:Valine--tRNA ligase [bioreactor metagenome]|uniref:valine--tRNA ligase n=1 Tax=bioreactor metagenome TaxID=1076179 RepID=A0A644ZC03_9ZZZZ